MIKKHLSCPRCSSFNVQPLLEGGIICLNCRFRGRGKEEILDLKA